MAFPVADWQFWIVTAAAAVAALWLLRSALASALAVLTSRRTHRAKPKRATLTVEGRPPAPHSPAAPAKKPADSCHDA